MAPAAFEEVADLVDNLNNHDAKKYLEKNLGLNDREARSAIYLYKRKHMDPTERPNWLPWVILTGIIIVIIFIIV